jgi:hypothetical protein
MADAIPQYEDTQPILTPVNVNSAAEGYEDFARTLGNIANQATEKAEDVETQQSQIMYINSVANAEQLKTKAQEMMLENPSQASKIAADSSYTLDTLAKNSYVNNQDRARLNAYIGNVNDDIGLKATETNVQQRQREAAFTLYANWPDQLRAYQDALINDPDQAENIKEAMTNSLHSMVMIGAIHPVQAASAMKSMSDVVGIAQDHYQVYGNPNSTAQDYNILKAHPLNQNSNDPNAPINQSTATMIDYYNSDRTFQGVKASISNGMLPDPQAFDALKPAERQQAIMMIRGNQIAKGLINSGEPYPAIEKTFQQLSTKGRVLSYQDEAVKNAIGTYMQDLKNGNYLSVIGQTPAGNNMMQNFVQNDAAIKNLAVDDNQKNTLLMQNKNNMVNAAVAYGAGHHIPDQYIQPIPQADVAQLENGFKLGQDPMTVLQTISQYNKSNQLYVAQSLKNPVQNMVVQGVSLAGNDVSPQSKLDFIAANQQGRTYLNKDIQNEQKDNELMTRIYSNLSPQMRLIQQNYDPERAQIMQNAMLTSTLNYAKFLAQKDNNIGLTDKSGFIGSASWKNYVDQASKIYGSAFQVMSGTNWMANPNQLPTPLTSGQLDILADHVTDEGYKYLREGRTLGEYDSATSRNPLKMVISPTNNLQAVDGNGKVYYTMPFTNNTYPFAKESQQRRLAEKQQASREAFETTNKELLNVRLPEDANAQ